MKLSPVKTRKCSNYDHIVITNRKLRVISVGKMQNKNDKTVIKLSSKICTILLFVAALVWGVAFVFQSIGGEILGAYSFNAARMYMGGLVVLICTVTFADRIGISKRPEPGLARRQIIVGIVCGIFLALGTNMQQIAMNAGASTGKAGFVTALYIVIVPILGLFFKNKPGINVWLSVVLALVGLYFLCIHGDFILSTGDLLLMCGAFGFALQIITIDQFGRDLDGLRLSGLQFITCAVISTILAIIFEIMPYDGGFSAWLSLFSSGKLWISLLYMGIFSCGLGYTLQILGQQNMNPTIASIIMSLESVFSALSGWIILNQTLSGRELIGCVLMFAAVVLTQIKFKSKDSIKNN